MDFLVSGVLRTPFSMCFHSSSFFPVFISFSLGLLRNTVPHHAVRSTLHSKLADCLLMVVRVFLLSCFVLGENHGFFFQVDFKRKWLNSCKEVIWCFKVHVNRFSHVTKVRFKGQLLFSPKHCSPRNFRRA